MEQYSAYTSTMAIKLRLDADTNCTVEFGLSGNLYDWSLTDGGPGQSFATFERIRQYGFISFLTR